MPIRWISNCAAGMIPLLMLTTVATAGELDELACEELWVRRNQIYADRGVCFKSERAVEVFGKRCFPPFGKLTDADEKALEDIRAVERAKKCKIDG